MNKKAFTLIELMITMTIIAMMMVVAVPGFEKYGKKSEFKLRATEVGALINQASVMAKNPEQGVARYVIKADATASASKVGLYKTDDATANLIKEVVLPSEYTLVVQTNADKKYLVFNSQLDFTCQTAKNSANTPAIADCAAAPDAFDFLTMSSTDGGTATLKIYADPLRVEY